MPPIAAIESLIEDLRLKLGIPDEHRVQFYKNLRLYGIIMICIIVLVTLAVMPMGSAPREMTSWENEEMRRQIEIQQGLEALRRHQELTSR